MTSQLDTLEDWAAGLLGKLEPGARSKVAKNIGQTLRRNQQQRIVTQRNPDGSQYASRKRRRLRGKNGTVKQKVQMFHKLRAIRFLKIKGDAECITVGFTGRIARIARVHQYGLKDRAERGALEVRYAKREILGLTPVDMSLIRDDLLKHLSSL